MNSIKNTVAWATRLLGLEHRREDRRRKLRRTMRLEALDKRECFAVSIGGVGFDQEVGQRTLVINGTDSADQVQIEWVHKDPLTPYDDKLNVYSQDGLVGSHNLHHSIDDQWVPEFYSVKFVGRKGNDSFKISGKTPTVYFLQEPQAISIYALGGDGNDRLEGGTGDDILIGGKGNDVMVGYAGSSSTEGAFKGDKIFGGDGNDVIFGDFDISQGQLPPSSYALVKGGYTYEDVLDGGTGNDSIYSGFSTILEDYAWEKHPPGSISIPSRQEVFGVDIAIGGLGNDNLFSDHYAELYGDLDDVQSNLRPDLAMQGGNDFLTTYSKTGSKLVAGAGDDTIQGGWGDDVIYGDSVQSQSGLITGNDVLFGDPIDLSADSPIGGKDKIFGGRGKDQLSGGGNEDYLDGGVGDDHIYGGSINKNPFTKDAADIIFGGTGGDSIYGGLGDDEISGQDGYDWIYGEEGHDSLEGGADNDHLFGGSGVDTIHGDDGADVLYGGEDTNVLDGGDGDDILWGGGALDNLYGRSGNDKLYGLGGDDVLFGGEGDDEISGGSGDDLLYGNEGIDKLWGESGNDFLDGGAGMVDWLVGGAGNDKFKKDQGGFGINLDKPLDFNPLFDWMI